VRRKKTRAGEDGRVGFFSAGCAKIGYRCGMCAGQGDVEVAECLKKHRQMQFKHAVFVQETLSLCTRNARWKIKSEWRVGFCVKVFATTVLFKSKNIFNKMPLANV